MSDATSVIVAVRDLPVAARIGVDPHEQGLRQPLIVSVEARIDAADATSLVDTVDYRLIAAAAQTLADQHIGLIEEYARRLGTECLALGAVASVSVTVAKPQALAQGTATATVVVARRISAQVVPFPSVAAIGGRTLRFAFVPGINADAQRVLAGMIDQFARTLRGVESCGVAVNADTGEWTAQVTLNERTGPRLAGAAMRAV